MIRIRHADLENCYENPRAWVEATNNPDKPFIQIGFNGIAKESIYFYHKDNSLDETIEYARNRIASRELKNEEKIQEVFSNVEQYVQWFERSGTIVADKRIRLDFEIIEEVKLGGMISRVDITESGYRALLIDVIKPDWKDELRFPLIQKVIAEKYCLPESEVSVGYQALDGSKIDEISFSKSKVSKIHSLVKKLANTLLEETEKYHQRANTINISDRTSDSRNRFVRL